MLVCGALCAALAPLVWNLPPAAAAITAPALVLYSADATAGEGGTLIRLRGQVPEADLVQQAIEIHVLVRELRTGTRFVAFSLPFGGFEGVDPTLADGVDADGVFSLLAAMHPSPTARILELAPDRIELEVPADFPSGRAEALLFLVYEGEPILSNPVYFNVEARLP